MTSEVCVMNKLGLVLAADSAVTISGLGGSKYLQGANKVFQISYADGASMAVMIYNSANLHGVPWEIIVKAFRNKSSGTVFKSVEECSDALFDFIKTSRDIFEDEQIRQDFFQRVYSEILEFLTNLENHEEAKRPSILGQFLQNVRDVDDRVGVSTEQIEKMVSDNFPEFLTNCRGSLSEQEKLLVLKFHNFSDEELKDVFLAHLKLGITGQQTGIVVAGFGSEQIFPATVTKECGGFMFEHFVIGQADVDQITHLSNSSLRGFAQSRMMNLIAQGYDVEIIGDIFEGLKNGLTRAIADLTGSDRALKLDPWKKHIQQIVVQTGETIFKQLKENTNERHTQKLLNVIATLSIPELAELAESLVELESLKEKVSASSQSVGGPTDVAAITKHEGLVWIKRKHYFAPEINPRYIKNL